MAKSQPKTNVQQNGRTVKQNNDVLIPPVFAGVQSTIADFGATIPAPAVNPIDQALALKNIKYLLAPEIIDLADAVIHTHWINVFLEQWSGKHPLILFRWVGEPEKKGGATAMATCRKVSGSNAWLYRQQVAQKTEVNLHNVRYRDSLNQNLYRHTALPTNAHVVESTPFFVITVWRWLWTQLDSHQRDALLFHELLHIVVEEDDKGKLKYSLRPYDLEEFTIVAKHYGAWDGATAVFKKALEERDSLGREQKFVPLEIRADKAATSNTLEDMREAGRAMRRATERSRRVREDLEGVGEAKHQCSESIDAELLGDAIRLVVTGRSASTSMLQRRFKIGYTLASQLLDKMEEYGVVGALDGSKPRDVLVDANWLEVHLAIVLDGGAITPEEKAQIAEIAEQSKTVREDLMELCDASDKIALGELLDIATENLIGGS